MEEITIYKIMRKSVIRIGNKEMFIFPETGKRYTYKEFDEKVTDVCRSMIALGIGKESHVGIWMANIEEWYILFFACNKIGAIAVPLNTSFKFKEMDEMLKKFDIDYLFMTKGYRGNYPEIINKIIPEMKIPCSTYPNLKEIVGVDFECDNCTAYDDFIGRGKNIDITKITKMSENMCSYDVAIILPTSGTTGIPKGVELTNGQLIKNGFDVGERYELNKADKMLIQVPMFHCFGITLSMIASLTHGASMCCISHFSPEKSIQVINDEQITCMNGVPTMYNDIINHPSFESDKVRSLKKGIMAGANCLPSDMVQAEESLGMTVFSVYGLTEGSPGCTMSAIYDSQDIRYNTVGEALPNIECSIINPKIGKECAIGEEGEFVVRGYNVMYGYYNDKEATNGTIDGDGWLHTGDLAKKRKDGTYVITGRIKDIIIRGGENISPKAVSVILNECSGVVDSCVCGIPDPKYGEIVAAAIKTDGTVTINEIMTYMKEMCPSYMIPARYKIVEYFPTNAAGKVLPHKVKKLFY